MPVSAAGGQAASVKIEFFSLRGAGLRDKKNSIFLAGCHFFAILFLGEKSIKKESHIMNDINSHIPFQKKKAKNRIIKYLALFIKVKKVLKKKAISRMFG